MLKPELVDTLEAAVDEPGGEITLDELYSLYEKTKEFEDSKNPKSWVELIRAQADA